MVASLIRIDSIKSTAIAISDGNTAHGSGGTVVAGASLLNGAVPVTIDDTGFHIGKSSAPLGGLLGGVDIALNAVLKAMNLQMHTLKTTSSVNGSQYNVVSGGLVITYDLPTTLTSLLSTLWLKLPFSKIGIPQIPGFLQNGVVTLTIGGATANVNATPAYIPPPDTGVTPASPGAPIASTPGAPSLAPSDTSTGTGASPGSVSSPSLAATPAALAPTTKRPTTTGLPLSPIGFFKGLKWLVVLLAIMGTIVFAGGLVKLSTDVLDPKAVTVCSLEGGP
jgi:hypothetical protein